MQNFSIVRAGSCTKGSAVLKREVAHACGKIFTLECCLRTFSIQFICEAGFLVQRTDW